MLRHTLAALLPLALLAAPAAARQDAGALIRTIESPQVPDRGGFDGLGIEEIMRRFRVPGVSVAVIRDFRVHWAKGYGVADVETGRPVTPETLFQAASISKPVTAMAAVALAGRGTLDLDGDVNSVLRSWKVPDGPLTEAHPVTPRSLMSHTSGADDGFGFPGYHPDAPRPNAVQVLRGEAPSNVGAVTFARAPYAGYQYSGGGVTLMQVLLTDLTGKPFETLLAETVLAPLAMTSSSYEQPLPATLAERAARAHSGQGRAMDAPWHVYPEQAAAGLWTTPSDLARFALEVQRALAEGEGEVLDRAGALEMVSPVGVGPYAVGLSVEQDGQGWYFGHTGSNWGFRAALRAHVRKGYGVAVMTNGDNGGAVIAEILSRVASAYGWDSLDKPIPR